MYSLGVKVQHVGVVILMLTLRACAHASDPYAHSQSTEDLQIRMEYIQIQYKYSTNT